MLIHNRTAGRIAQLTCYFGISVIVYRRITACKLFSNPLGSRIQIAIVFCIYRQTHRHIYRYTQCAGKHLMILTEIANCVLYVFIFAAVILIRKIILKLIGIHSLCTNLILYFLESLIIFIDILVVSARAD